MKRLPNAVPKPRKRPKKAPKPIARSVRPKRRNQRRAAANYERAYSDAYGDWIRSKPCCVCGVTGRTVAAHTKNGGGSRKGGKETLVPLCSTGPQIWPAFNRTLGLREGCHEAAYDRVGVQTFQKMHGIDLRSIAARLYAEFQTLAPEAPR